MTPFRSIVALAVACALLAQPVLAETTDRHRAFRAWQAYCSDANRPKNETTVHYCDGFRFAASFVPRSDAAQAGVAPPATMPDGRRAAAGMGRAPPGGLPLTTNPVGLAREDRSEPSRATSVLLGGWIDAQ